MSRRHPRAGRRVTPGTVVVQRSLDALSGSRVRVPDDAQLVHLQFRRFAGCPFCTLHLASIERRHDELAAAGIKEVVVFHSSPEALRKHQNHEFPFEVVPDPGKRLYREFGVDRSVLAILDPRVFLPELRGIITKFRRRKLGLDLHGGLIGLPADFLIAPTGEVHAARYGRHAYDQWSVDDVLAIAAEYPASPAVTTSDAS